MKILLALMLSMVSLFAINVDFVQSNNVKNSVSKMCIDGHVYYYTTKYAPIVPKLIYETRSGKRYNALPQTAIYHATCKESK